MKYTMRKLSHTPFDGEAVHEECGVFGIYVPEGENLSPAHEAYTALFALQHRGQEACGIAVNNRGVIRCHKDIGLVNDVFDQDILDAMPGQMAIGVKMRSRCPLRMSRAIWRWHTTEIWLTPELCAVKLKTPAVFSARLRIPRCWCIPLCANVSNAAPLRTPC